MGNFQTVTPNFTNTPFVNHSELGDYSATGVRLRMSPQPITLPAGRWWLSATPGNNLATSPFCIHVSTPGSTGFPALRRDAGAPHMQPSYAGMYSSTAWQWGGPQRDISMKIEGYYLTPGAFGLLLPIDNATRVSTTPTFDWENAPRATAYLLEVDDQPTFDSPLISVPRPVSAYATPPGILPPNTQLYWRVTATNAEGSTLCSQGSRTFTTANPPPPCAADANNDSLINGADLSLLLGQFGNPPPPEFSADFNNDAIVNAADLSILLSSFGQECL